jgi:uncharacterized protein
MRFLTLASGGLIGLVLGLVGGGGSILAVPLLVYVVGVASPHVAIGTAAIAVAANAAFSLAGHARAGHVKWRCATVFTGMSVVGAAIGATAGKATDGRALLALFGVLMVAIGAVMLHRKATMDRPDVRLTRATASNLLPRLIPAGLGVGLLAGFFGIGGGFLIVPALMRSTKMPISFAIGTSLVAVTALGLTTSASYALSGQVDWQVAGLLITGGIAGVAAGLVMGRRLAPHKGLMERGFALIVIAAGLFIVTKGL